LAGNFSDVPILIGEFNVGGGVGRQVESAADWTVSSTLTEHGMINDIKELCSG
jgi:hypothetical protein